MKVKFIGTDEKEYVFDLIEGQLRELQENKNNSSSDNSIDDVINFILGM